MLIRQTYHIRHINTHTNKHDKLKVIIFRYKLCDSNKLFMIVNDIVDDRLGNVKRLTAS